MPAETPTILLAPMQEKGNMFKQIRHLNSFSGRGIFRAREILNVVFTGLCKDKESKISSPLPPPKLLLIFPTLTLPPTTFPLPGPCKCQCWIHQDCKLRWTASNQSFVTTFMCETSDLLGNRRCANVHVYSRWSPPGMARALWFAQMQKLSGSRKNIHL